MSIYAYAIISNANTVNKYLTIPKTYLSININRNQSSIEYTMMPMIMMMINDNDYINVILHIEM